MKNSVWLIVILIYTSIIFSSCISIVKKLPVSGIGRGINIANALEAPNEGDWGVIIEDDFFSVISSAGFTCVRIPVRWSAHALEAFPFTIDEEFFTRIDRIVELAMNNGLKIIINVHHYDEFTDDPEGHSQRFESLWLQIAERYSQIDGGIYFELLNEPHGNLTTQKWNTIMNRTIETIRTISKDRKIIITGANWGSAYSLEGIDLKVDRENLIASVHIYTPALFTKQGAPWMGDVYSTTGVQWPGPPETPINPVPAAAEDEFASKWFAEYNDYPYEKNPAGPLPITTELDKAYLWSLFNGIPVFVGEFGSYDAAEIEYRHNWTLFLRKEIEKRNLSWIYWDFAAGFAAYDTIKREWIPQIFEALFQD